MLINQEFISSNKWYRLQYPRTWECEIVENIPSFFDPLFGKGALQILSINMNYLENTKDVVGQYPFMAGNNIDDKMKIFLHTHSISFEKNPPRHFINKDMIVLPYEFMQGGHFFMVVMFQRDNIFLLCLYNSPGLPEDEESKTIASIIQSIEITGEQLI